MEFTSRELSPIGDNSFAHLSRQLERKSNFATPKPIAKHHRNLMNKHKPMLEISPAGEEMMELIVVTWAYVEKWRRKKQKGARGTLYNDEEHHDDSASS